MDELDFYVPSDLMLKAFKTNFNDENLIAAESKFAAYLQTRQLNTENVCMVMRLLLSIEDISTMYIFAQLEETERVLQQFSYIDQGEQKIIYKIMISQTRQNPEDVLTADIDELVLVPIASILASPRPKHIILEQLPHIHEGLGDNEKTLRRVGHITKVERTKVTFRCESYSLLQSFRKQKFKVIFRSTRIPIRLMYQTLEILEESDTIRNYIFPSHNQDTNLQTSGSAKSELFPLINASIATNAEQLQAVKQIFCGPSTLAPYIVFGPPGTGKTTTIVEAILQLYLRKNTRIIVTAGSNSACDTIALRICECIEQDARFTYDRKKPNQAVLRVFSSSRSKEYFKLVHPLILRNSNYDLIMKIKKAIATYQGKGPLYKELLDNLLKKLSEEFKEMLRSHRIIVATLCKVGSMRDLLNETGKITHIFIDEAAASSEPETLLGIVNIKKEYCHVILSGDHKQLGPVIKSKRASTLGLGQSLMGRLMDSDFYKVDDSGNYDSTLQTRLRRNYRSHPEIVGLFNKLYYNNELIPLAPLERVNQAANWDILPSAAQFPILFQATFGNTERKPLSYSSYNELEAQVLCWYVWILLKKGLGNDIQVKPEDIGVISPYLAQCALITKMLRQRGQVNVKVGSVESFQGREKPIIIASFVCSFKNTTFLSDPRRLNVLLSRPMSLLILIGNPLSLCQSTDLKFIIDQCKLHKHLLNKSKENKKKKNKITENQQKENKNTEDKKIDNQKIENKKNEKQEKKNDINENQKKEKEKIEEKNKNNKKKEKQKKKNENKKNNKVKSKAIETQLSTLSLNNSNNLSSVSLNTSKVQERLRINKQL